MEIDLSCLVSLVGEKWSFGMRIDFPYLISAAVLVDTCLNDLSFCNMLHVEHNKHVTIQLANKYVIRF